MKDIIGLILAVLILFGGCGTDSPDDAEAMKEYSFFCSDVKIEMHGPAAPVLEALGEPNSYTEVTSCAFDGLDKTYYYGSFYLSTYPDGDKDNIQSLWFADDSVATDEGIRIGDSQEAVEAAYGSDGYNGSNGYIQTGNNSKLTILLTDGLVSSIQYEAIIS